MLSKLIHIKRKTHLLIILNVLFISFIEAQNSFYFELENSFPMQGMDIVETNNNEYIILVLVHPTYGYDILVKLSANGEVLSQLPLGSTDTIINLSRIHRVDDNHIVVTGLAHLTENMSDTYAVQIHFDDEMQPIEQIYTQIPLNLEIFYTALDESNNLTWAGSYGPFGQMDLAIAKIDMFGNLINFNTHTSEGNHYVNDIIQYSSDPVIYGISVTGPMEGNTNQGLEFFLQFDDELQYLKTSKIPNIAGVGNTNMAIVSSGLIAFAGKGFTPSSIMYGFNNYLQAKTLNWYLGSYATDIYKSVLVLANELISPLVYITFGDGIIRDFPAPYSAICSFENNTIYTAGIKNIIPFEWPFQQEPSWIRVNKLDAELNIIWEKYFGGDAYYQVNTVTATSDGGVIVSGFKTYPGQAPLMNLLVIKLKPDGTVSLDENPYAESLPKFIIYPNPATNQVWLQLPENMQLSQAQIELYSPTGRLLYKVQLTSQFHMIEVAHFPRGLYQVRVWDGEKWLVEKLVVH